MGVNKEQIMYPSFRLIIKNEKGKEVCNVLRYRKRSLLLRLTDWKKRRCSYYLKVVYCPGFKNEGEYSTKQEAIHAYRAFTEKDLIDSFKGGE